MSDFTQNFNIEAKDVENHQWFRNRSAYYKKQLENGSHSKSQAKFIQDRVKHYTQLADAAFNEESNAKLRSGDMLGYYHMMSNEESRKADESDYPSIKDLHRKHAKEYDAKAHDCVQKLLNKCDDLLNSTAPLTSSQLQEKHAQELAQTGDLGTWLGNRANFYKSMM